MLEKDFLPIICPIGMDDTYQSYNVNADDAACAIAKALGAEKLAFLTDIEGVRVMIGYAMCGSYCTHSESIKELRSLSDKGYDLIGIVSENVFATDTRFGKASELVEKVESICQKKSSIP